MIHLSIPSNKIKKMASISNMEVKTETIVTSEGLTIQVMSTSSQPPVIVIEEPWIASKNPERSQENGLELDQFMTVDPSKVTQSQLENIPKIGTHMSRSSSKQSLAECFNEFSIRCATNGNVPCQMFLRNPHRGSDAIPDDDFDIARHVIEANDIRYYTHSAYIINLSKPTTQRNPNSDKWIMSLLTKDLVNTHHLGGKGVVVHVGKHLKMSIPEATDKMEHYIRLALVCATEQCPLLLETAAGQGTELCTTIEELSSLYSRFSEDEHRSFKICVDTCHVFSAGYDPLDFLIRWDRLHPNSIGLVHFNDSDRGKGSRVDRHSHYLKGGYIGFERLMEVAQWCLDHEIEMVTE